MIRFAVSRNPLDGAEFFVGYVWNGTTNIPRWKTDQAHLFDIRQEADDVAKEVGGIVVPIEIKWGR